MSTVLQPFLDLLIKPPGNLIYHLVVAFSLVSVLPVSLYLHRGEQKSSYSRLFFGLLPLLALRIGLFIGGGLAWQGLIVERALLPPLERSVALLSLLTLLWLWVFPQPRRHIDRAALVFVFFGLFFAVFLALWWHNQQSSAPFNGSRTDQIATLGNAILALLALALLLVMRPEGWSTGMLFFLVLGAGYWIHYLFPPQEGDYSGVTRLAEIAAYPLLIMLPLRSALPALEPAVSSSAVTTIPARLTPLEVQLIQTCLSLPIEMQKGRLVNTLSALFARALRADLCCLVSPPDESWQILLHGGYDLIREVAIEGGVLDGRQMPTLAATLRHAKPVRIQADAPTPDLNHLASALKLERSGSLLMASIPAEDQAPLFGVMLLSPYSNRPWSGDEQMQLVNLCRSVGKLLRQLQLQAQTGAELTETKKALAEAKEQLEALQAELTALREQRVLEAEVVQQSNALALPLASNRVGAEEELRLALEEIARLRAELDTIRRQLEHERSENNRAEVTKPLLDLATELRQPLASIVGYTDFLLSESVGILGSLQRKFLERIRLATQRMTTILDDYTPATALKGSQVQLKLEAVSLAAVLDNALAQVQELKRDRQVELQSEVPADLPPVLGDPGALEQILVKLLQNALMVSPAGSTVRVRVRNETDNAVQGYLLLQVQDCGSGIAPEDLPGVFARERRTEIKGVAESGATFYLVKTLVEALNARIWVDSQPGEGTTFSILLALPTSSPEGELAEESKL